MGNTDLKTVTLCPVLRVTLQHYGIKWRKLHSVFHTVFAMGLLYVTVLEWMSQPPSPTICSNVVPYEMPGVFHTLFAFGFYM